MKPEAKQITVAAKLKGPFVFGSQLMVQQLAECALLLAKDSAGKQSNKTLYLLTVSILKALYLLAVSVLKVQRLLTVKVKIGQQQQLAESALPLLLAKGSAGKQSDTALYPLTVAVLKALHLLTVKVKIGLQQQLAECALKALYLLASPLSRPCTCLLSLSSRPCTCSPSPSLGPCTCSPSLSSRPCTCSQSTPQVPPNSSKFLKYSPSTPKYASISTKLPPGPVSCNRDRARHFKESPCIVLDDHH